MGTNTSTIGGGSYYFLPRFFFRAILVVGFVCLIVVVGSLGRVNGGTRKVITTHQYWSSSSSSEGVKHGQVMKGRDDKAMNHQELDYFNYMSKRRVPNGPDPIHNRRAGNSGRPPGQA